MKIWNSNDVLTALQYFKMILWTLKKKKIQLLQLVGEGGFEPWFSL